jgi:hypothetical protein
VEHPAGEGGFRNPKFLVLACIFGGFLVRLACGLGFAVGETPNTALTFARTGTLADPFLPGTGTTAHVTPLPPLYQQDIKYHWRRWRPPNNRSSMSGDITPGEAASLSTLVGNVAKAVETVEIVPRLAKLEEQLAARG